MERIGKTESTTNIGPNPKPSQTQPERPLRRTWPPFHESMSLLLTWVHGCHGCHDPGSQLTRDDETQGQHRQTCSARCLRGWTCPETGRNRGIFMGIFHSTWWFLTIKNSDLTDLTMKKGDLIWLHHQNVDINGIPPPNILPPTLNSLQTKPWSCTGSIRSHKSF